MIGLAGILDTSWGEQRGFMEDGVTPNIHNAIDFNKPKTNILGLDIHSVSNGTVTAVAPNANGDGGWWIIITADNGTVWTYCHFHEATTLTVGSKVIGGSTVVGKVGNTGTSSGPHLHLQCKQNGTLIDPRTKIGNSDC